MRRSDGVVAYQLAVVVDDAAQGVTHVVRGADLLASTARQIRLYELLGLDPVPTYAHVPLLLGDDGERLAKRHGAVGLTELRKAEPTRARSSGGSRTAQGCSQRPKRARRPTSSRRSSRAPWSGNRRASIRRHCAGSLAAW